MKFPKKSIWVIAPLLFGSVAAFAGEPGGLGGFNNYQGPYVGWNDKETVRYEGDFQSSQTLGNNAFRIEVHAKAYNDGNAEGSQQARIELTVTINDEGNYFNPDANLPVIVRGILAGYSRTTSWSTDSRSVILERTFGQRKFVGNFTFHTKSNGGAEWVQVLNKLEILLPGVPLATVSFESIHY